MVTAANHNAQALQRSQCIKTRKAHRQHLQACVFWESVSGMSSTHVEGCNVHRTFRNKLLGFGTIPYLCRCPDDDEDLIISCTANLIEQCADAPDFSDYVCQYARFMRLKWNSCEACGGDFINCLLWWLLQIWWPSSPLSMQHHLFMSLESWHEWVILRASDQHKRFLKLQQGSALNNHFAIAVTSSHDWPTQ